MRERGSGSIGGGRLRAVDAGQPQEEGMRLPENERKRGKRRGGDRLESGRELRSVCVKHACVCGMVVE